MGKTHKSARYMPFSTHMKALKTIGVFKRVKFKKKIFPPFCGCITSNVEQLIHQRGGGAIMRAPAVCRKLNAYACYEGR